MATRKHWLPSPSNLVSRVGTYGQPNRGRVGQRGSTDRPLIKEYIAQKRPTSGLGCSGVTVTSPSRQGKPHHSNLVDLDHHHASNLGISLSIVYMSFGLQASLLDSMEIYTRDTHATEPQSKEKSMAR